MRISTSLIFDTNVSTMNRQQSNLMTLQQQLSLNSRVTKPSDDPVAAAQALTVKQASAVVQQQMSNQGTADDALKSLESKLAAIGDIITYAKERTIQAGNGALNADDLKSIATDLKSQFDSLLSLANSTDSNGQYMFAGFKGDTVPFSGNLSGGVNYQGDRGQRTLQVSDTRLMPVSDNGMQVFMSVDNLNGSFNASGAAGNSGAAVISGGTVTGSYTGGQYGIRFTSGSTYEIFDRAADPGMTGAPMATGTYTSGGTIDLPPAPAAGQVQVAVSGTPATGDTFTVDPGGQTDMFSTLQQLISVLDNASGAALQQGLADAGSKLDNALDNVLKLRSQVGSRQTELDALQSLGTDAQQQYTDRINKLTGLDYASTISDFSMQNVSLQAAQQSFIKISGLSLFNFLK
ncbi:MAG: flagellar hook-associated protein FlgL [Rhodocyclaceae bacterium]